MDQLGTIHPVLQTVRPLSVLRGTIGIRVAIGTTLALATRRLLAAMLRHEQPSSSFVLFARTVGIRDALFGLGCLLASLDASRPVETRRWVQVWLANEVADVLAAIASTRQLGVAGAVAAAAVPIPFIAADVWVLRHLEVPPSR